MTYKELIDLGFKRHDSPDPVHFNQTGNEWFYLSKKLAKGVTAEWYPEMENKPVGISPSDDTSDQFFVYDRDFLEKIIKVFSKKRKT